MSRHEIGSNELAPITKEGIQRLSDQLERDRVTIMAAPNAGRELKEEIEELIGLIRFNLAMVLEKPDQTLTAWMLLLVPQFRRLARKSTEALGTAAPVMGACRYGNTLCFEMSQEDCMQASGAFIPGASCT